MGSSKLINKKKLPTIIRGVSYAAETGLSAMFGICITLFVARSNSLEIFGSFSFIIALVTIQQQVAVFGFSKLFYGRQASRQTNVFRLIWPAIISSSFISVLLYLTTILLLLALQNNKIFDLYILAGLRIFSATGIILISMYQAKSDVAGYIPVRTVILLFAIIGAITAFIHEAEPVIYILIWVTESILTSLILLLKGIYSKAILIGSRPRYRSLLFKAYPLAVQVFFVLLYIRFDQVYIQFYFGEVSLGIYAAAAKVAEASNMIFSVILLITAPRIISEWRSIRKFSQHAWGIFIFFAILTFIATMFCLLFGEELLVFIFGEKFSAGSAILTVYIISTCFVGYGTIGSQINSAIGRTNNVMLSGIIGGIINVLLTIVLCYFFGLIGAAMATLVSYAIAVAILFFPLANGRVYIK